MHPKQYQQLKFCILCLLLMVGVGVTRPNEKPEIKIALVNEFQSRLEKNIIFNYELLRQVAELNLYFKETLEEQKNYIVKIDPVIKFQQSYSDKELLSLEEEFKSYLKQTLSNNPIAIIRGTYIIVGDLVILTLGLFDAKTGAYTSFAISEKAKNCQLDVKVRSTIKEKLKKKSQEIIEHIAAWNNLN